jgi:uncharacterized protein (TIGR02246 family)
MPLSTDDLIRIQQLYARYNTAIDTGDGEAFAACFVPEGRFNPGHGLLEGHAAIAAFAVDTHKNMPLMRHDATNIVIDGDGDEARGSAFLIGYLAGPGYKVIVTGRYRDQLTRTRDGWRFVDRQFSMDQ